MVFDLLYEKGIIKKDWRDIDLSFGLIYPNRYKFAISSYAIRLLYSYINSKTNVVCERFTLPDNITYPASHDSSSIISIRSIETKILAKEFDILGFSIHYENDFKNVLWFLDKAKFPIYSKNRHANINKESDKFPLIIAGGPAITSNPLPLSKIIDCFFIGDAEPNLYEFLDYCIEYKTNIITYDQLLKKVANVDGIYVPEITKTPKRMILKNLDNSPLPSYQLFTDNYLKSKIFEHSYFLEVNRGCPYKCKFCISSFHNFPFRNRSFDEIVKFIDEAVALAKFDKFAFIGSCVSSHPRFIDICKYIIEKGKKFSIPSIRIDHINIPIIEVLEKGNIETITIAPEVGSDSLRFEIGKRISNEKILETLSLIKASKIKNVKFYFLIGIPNETNDDITAIIDLISDIDNLGFNKGELKVNVNPFIPKLNTPYYRNTYFYMSENFSLLRKRFQYLVKALKTFKSIKLKVGNIKRELNEAKLQTLISLGDTNITELLIEYYRNGAIIKALNDAKDQLNFNIDYYFEKIQDSYNPWQFEFIEK